LEKSISRTLYLDYNATSPLATSVKRWITKGDLIWGNTSSVHSEGRKALSALYECNDTILNLFGFSDRDYDLVHHSGATEALYTLITGFAKNHKQATFYHLATDHVAVIEAMSEVSKLGHTVVKIPVSKNGEFDWNLISKKESSLFVLTWINNETGIGVDLKRALQLEIPVVVDAVQAPGKIEINQGELPKLAAYVFSSHKFGGLKGHGFTLINKSLHIAPLYIGGQQQRNRRGGTVNVQGAVASSLALSETLQHYNSEGSLIVRNSFETTLLALDQRIAIIGKDAKIRATNTVSILFPKPAVVTIPMLDLGGVAASSGSACSSGSLKESRVLLESGFTSVDAASMIRFSFSPLATLVDLEDGFKRVATLLCHQL